MEDDDVKTVGGEITEGTRVLPASHTASSAGPAGRAPVARVEAAGGRGRRGAVAGLALPGDEVEVVGRGRLGHDLDLVIGVALDKNSEVLSVGTEEGGGVERSAVRVEQANVVRLAPHVDVGVIT